MPSSRYGTKVLVAAVLLAVTACTHPRPNSARGYAHIDHITAGDLSEAASGDTAAESAAILRDLYPRGLALTKQSEGWRRFLYNDVAAFCTIGYGHLVKKQSCDGTEPEEFRNGLTEPEGTNLLISDMANARSTVAVAVTAKLADGQYAALCDFVFNVGSTNFRTSTLLRLVNAEQNDAVPAQFRRWVLAGGKLQAGLKKRREREIELYFEELPKPQPVESAEVVDAVDIHQGENGSAPQ